MNNNKTAISLWLVLVYSIPDQHFHLQQGQLLHAPWRRIPANDGIRKHMEKHTNSINGLNVMSLNGTENIYLLAPQRTQEILGAEYKQSVRCRHACS